MLSYTSASFEPGYAIALLFAVLLFVLRAYWQYRKDVVKEMGNDMARLALKDVREIMAEAPKVLGERVPYFSRLSAHGKDKFLARLQVIIAQKDFVAMEGLEVTHEMVILAAAGFVQVTFGLQSFELSRFNAVYIYPDKFYNRLLEALLKGSASPNGNIRLSWKHLEHGFKVEDDGINLALHELAHALKISIEREDNEVDQHLFQSLQVFLTAGQPVRSQLLKGKIEVLRRYAAVNEHEFFACCVELFFEAAFEFKKEMPRLYATMCELMRQDLTNEQGDYAVKSTVHERRYIDQLKSKVLPSPESSYSYVQGVILLGLFVGMYTFFFQLSPVLSSGMVVWLYAASITAVGAMIFYNRLLKTGYTSTLTFSFFLLLGWLPCVGSLGLLANRLIPVYHHTEYHEVRSVGLEAYRLQMSYDHPMDRVFQKGPLVSVDFFKKARAGEMRLVTEAHSYYGILALENYHSHHVLVIQGSDTTRL